MARKKLSMTVWQEIQRLKNLGHNKSEVPRLLNLNRETVIKYWNENSSVENNSPAWVTKLDWKYIGEELDRDVPKKILYEEQSQSVELLLMNPYP
jgi:orotate phosphoribosyltransferase-like protein